MATEKQIEANRLNAEKSTGPTSPEGQARSCMNRLSWGFASNTVIIPGEDPAEFRGLVEDLLAEHQPVCVTEQILVEKMALHQWLSLRAFRLQGEAFLDLTLQGDGFGIPKSLGVLIRYQTSAERTFHRAHNELVKAQKERKKSEIGFESQKVAEAAVEPSRTNPTTRAGNTETASDDAPDLQHDLEIAPDALEALKNVA